MKKYIPGLLMVLSYTILLFYGCLHHVAYGTLLKCPDLVPGLNQVVSSTEGFIGDSVQVSCEPGFVLDIGALSKDVQCVGNDSTAMWDESLGNCTAKECNSVPLGNNMTATDGSGPFLIGDNITVMCNTGHAFSVNLTLLNVTDRVTASQVLTCLDDPSSLEGKWSELTGNCSVIECRAPLSIPKSTMSYTEQTYGSTIMYRCYSGHIIGSKHTRIATCTQNAEWNIPGYELESGNLACGKLSNYVGCLPSSAVSSEESYTTPSLDADACVRHCRSSSYRLAAVHEDNCTCGNGLASNYDVMDDEMCNITCAGYDGTDQFQSVFCGGPGPLSSVYVTIDGCYENITVDMSESEDVLPEAEITCIERCRAKAFVNAAIFNTTCFCLNTSQVDGIQVDKSNCDSSDSAQYVYVQDLAKTQVTAENCSMLFESGIRMHGTYVMKDGSKTFCNFKDGTVCDTEWVGYNGNCYLFYTDVKMDFTTARNFCIGHEADLVSILSRPEASFMRTTRQLFTDLKGRSWYVGMIDSHNTSLFSWLDGNLFRYSRFADREPSSVGRCIKDQPGAYLWSSVTCSFLQYAVCKKTENLHKCASVDTTNAVYTKLEPTMSLPYCVEVCRGKNANFSAVAGTTCYCLSTIPTGTEYTSIGQCDTPCPGDPYQFCGNAENYTLIEVPGRLPAQSCEDLQLVGIGNGSFVIQSDGETTLQDCATPVCPYAWLEIRGRCYRFNPVQTSSSEARQYCSRYDAYAVVLETIQEAEELMNTVSNISVYDSTILWRIGLQSLSISSGLYRWSNGKMPSNSFWNNNFIVHNGTEVLVPKDNFTEWEARVGGNYAFMCEKGQDILDYIGCYNASGLVWDYNTTDFDQMTIQQCVEWCRAGGRLYAYLSPMTCACSDTLKQHAPDGVYCYESCSGQENQVCGGDGLMSVYNISEYEAKASQCSSLRDDSIFLSGSYEIGGVIQHCDLADSTVCETGWLGFNSSCYKYDPSLQKDNDSWWYDNDVVMTSITTANEEQFLRDFLKRLFLGYQPGRIFTGLKDTYQLRIYSNQDGLIFKPNDLTSDYPISQDFTSFIGFDIVGFGLSLSGDHLGFMAKKDKHKVGCFEIPSWISPVLSNFPSMELTLCKQLCLANDAEIALMTLNSCYCGNSSLTSLLTSSADEKCKNRCQVHPTQWCGDYGSAIAYRIVEDEAHLAPDCNSLYLSGIFYNSTFKLGNQTHTRLENCGFTDSTNCPASWFGKEGECYKLFVTPKVFSDARLECFHKDSYLFNPTKNSEVWSLMGHILNIPVLNDTGFLISGIRAVFFNKTYVTSDGLRIEECPAINPISIPENYTQASITDTAWQSFHPDEALPFLCQKDDDYLGCNEIHSPPEASIDNVVDNSLTQCMEYCRGQDTTFFAASDTSCKCYSTLPSFTSQEGRCEIPCPGADTQPCGGVGSNGTLFLSLFHISNKTSLAKSCLELARYGVRYPGMYYIEPDPAVGAIKVTCFRPPSPVSVIGKECYKRLTASSSLTVFDPARTFHDYSLQEIWKPNTNDANQYMKASLDGVHIVTGVILSGLHTYNDASWVTKVKITYRDPLSGTMVDYLHIGTNQIEANINGIDESYTFFSRPFVTEEVTIKPLEWHSSIALKVYLLGQLYKDFNHENFYIGCVLDPFGIFNDFGSGSMCDDIADCAALDESFMSLDGNGNCYCGLKSGITGFEYGFVDGHCSLNGTAYIGQGTIFKALYRTYEKKCLSPRNITDGQIANITYPYVSNVYPYGTTTNYACDVGYEFGDGSTDVTIACRQDNMWDNITQSCNIISCPSFNVTNGVVDIYSLEYLGEAHVMCDRSNWANNGEQNMTVTCKADKNWTVMPTCEENNLKENIRYFSNYGKKKRDPITMIVESTARSSLDCTVKCTTAYYCKGANYKRLSDGKGTCRLFTKFADPSDLTDNLNWKYFETYDIL